MLGGLLRLGGPASTREEPYKVALDLAMVLTSGSMLLWYLVLGPILQREHTSAMAMVVSAAYPVLDLALSIPAPVQRPDQAERAPPPDHRFTGRPSSSSSSGSTSSFARSAMIRSTSSSE